MNINLKTNHWRAVGIFSSGLASGKFATQPWPGMTWDYLLSQYTTLTRAACSRKGDNLSVYNVHGDGEDGNAV